MSVENDKGQLVSFFHDIPCYADEEANLVHMVCEIPKWSNAKLEVS